MGSRPPSLPPGGQGPGRPCCQGSLGRVTERAHAALTGKPRYGACARRCQPRCTRLPGPGRCLSRCCRTGLEGLGSRGTPCRVPQQRSKAATALWRTDITSSGGSRSSGTRGGPSCLTSIAVPQRARHPPRGLSDERVQTSVTPWERQSLMGHRLGNAIRPWRALVAASRCPTCSGYPRFR
jgi:hypothetical protein